MMAQNGERLSITVATDQWRPLFWLASVAESVQPSVVHLVKHAWLIDRTVGEHVLPLCGLGPNF